MRLPKVTTGQNDTFSWDYLQSLNCSYSTNGTKLAILILSTVPPIARQIRSLGKNHSRLIINMVVIVGYNRQYYCFAGQVIEADIGIGLRCNTHKDGLAPQDEWWEIIEQMMRPSPPLHTGDRTGVK